MLQPRARREQHREQQHHHHHRVAEIGLLQDEQRERAHHDERGQRTARKRVHPLLAAAQEVGKEKDHRKLGQLRGLREQRPEPEPAARPAAHHAEPGNPQRHQHHQRHHHQRHHQPAQSAQRKLRKQREHHEPGRDMAELELEEVKRVTGLLEPQEIGGVEHHQDAQHRQRRRRQIQPGVELGPGDRFKAPEPAPEIFARAPHSS